MTELPPDKKQALKAIEESLHRMALKVLEAPMSEREAVYEIMRESLAETQRALNFDENESASFEKNYMIWLRALVDMIERGGGAQGGKA
jgi:hypothetical protein